MTQVSAKRVYPHTTIQKNKRRIYKHGKKRETTIDDEAIFEIGQPERVKTHQGLCGCHNKAHAEQNGEIWSRYGHHQNEKQRNCDGKQNNFEKNFPTLTHGISPFKRGQQ
jgi:hypothetical protein